MHALGMGDSSAHIRVEAPFMVFRERLAVCRQCEHWRSVCLKGHALHGVAACPVGRFGCRALVTLLLPTRRPDTDFVRRTIQSFRSMADHPEHVEILVRLDDDCVQQKDELEALGVKVYIGPRYRGYRDLHLFYNELAAEATGDWLWLMNDDVIIETRGWDTLLGRVAHANKAGITELWPKTRVCGEVHYWANDFPLMSRAFYETLGHFSMSPLNDCYVRLLALSGSIERPYDVVVEHFYQYSLKGDDAGASACAFHHSAESQQHMDADLDKLRRAGLTMLPVSMKTNRVVYPQ